MYKKVTDNGFNLHNHLTIAKVLFFFFNLLVFTIYGFLLVIFAEFPINLAEESVFALNLFAIATGAAATASMVNFIGDALYCYVRKPRTAHEPLVSYGLSYNVAGNDPAPEPAFAS